MHITEFRLHPLPTIIRIAQDNRLSLHKMKVINATYFWISIGSVSDTEPVSDGEILLFSSTLSNKN